MPRELAWRKRAREVYAKRLTEGAITADQVVDLVDAALTTTCAQGNAEELRAAARLGAALKPFPDPRRA